MTPVLADSAGEDESPPNRSHIARPGRHPAHTIRPGDLIRDAGIWYVLRRVRHRRGWLVFDLEVVDEVGRPKPGRLWPELMYRPAELVDVRRRSSIRVYRDSEP